MKQKKSPMWVEVVSMALALATGLVVWFFLDDFVYWLNSYLNLGLEL
jgi:hypothetical protein